MTMRNLGMISALLASASVAGSFEPRNGSTCNATYFDDLADAVGTLEMADVGAYPQRGMMPRGRGPAPRPRLDARVMIPNVPGVPAPGMRLQPLGLGATAFTASSGTTLQLTGNPQRPFKGQRLVIDITRTGTTATGLVTISRLDIGTANQLVSSGALSAAAFAPTAFDCNIKLDPATPGISITLVLNISVAPGSSDRVDVGGTIFGTAIG